MAKMLWRNTEIRYGCITRFLHWTMATLFLWQFISALLHLFASKTPADSFFWATHYSLGFTLWLLVLVRGTWGLVNLKNRPGHSNSILLRAATAGHVAMYALMVLIPTLALLRALGNGRGLRVYGLQFVSPGGEPNPALTAPANAAHGLLGWVLLVMIVGHVGMALWHEFVRGDGTLGKMAGS